MWIILCLVLTLVYCVLILVYTIGFVSKNEYTNTETSKETTVAIVIPTRNERKNIFNCLNSISDQSYPNFLFGIIVIDDFSEDDTVNIVQSFNNENIKVFSLGEFISQDEAHLSHKKMAIENAINQTEADLIICIDADCTFEKKWLSTIVSYYEKHKPKFITAPVLLSPAFRFIQKFQVLDFIGMMVTTSSVNKYKLGLMSNGANMCFERKAFLDVNGYAGVKHIISGDDIFLMQKIEDTFPNSCQFIKSKNAIATSPTQINMKQFLNQRLRWASKNKNSKDWKLNLQLLFVFLFNFSVLVNFLGLILAVLLNNSIITYSLILFAQLLLKIIVDFIYLNSGCKFFEQQKLMKQFFLSQIYHIVYINYVAIFANFGKFNWKGRKYK